MRQAQALNIGDIITLLPINIPFFIGRLINSINLKLLIIVESEFWPNLLRMTSKKAKIILLNGRISDRYYTRYLFLKRFMKQNLSSIDFFSMRTQGDYDRIVHLGAEEGKTTVGGDIKFDLVSHSLNGV